MKLAIGPPLRRPPLLGIVAILTALASAAGGVVYLSRSVSTESMSRWRAWRRGAVYLGSEGVVAQRRDNDCGVASLLTLLTLRGTSVDTRRVYAAVPLGGGGASMLALRNAAERFGIPLRGWLLPRRELASSDLPAILLLDGKHFVVARRLTGTSEIEVLDPALGRLLYSSRSLKRHWDGRALLVGENPAATQRDGHVSNARPHPSERKEGS